MKSLLSEKEKQEWLAICKEAKETSTDRLIGGLQLLSNGANVHTINKAISYLTYFSSNIQARFKYGKNYDILNELKSYVLEALKSGDVTHLRSMMKRWW